jgi:hypothetical protein
MTEQIRGLTGEQISALELLAGCPDGCTDVGRSPGRISEECR